MLRRRRAFTLIELLVVIAIIGILAAMVFPVFARARESARKAVCLSNVKNIALALNMYIDDYNGFMPLGAGVDQYAAAYFNAEPGGGTGGGEWPDTCNRERQGNPYVREPAILDEYVKNRDVWRCPSAKMETGATLIVPVVPNRHWVDTYKEWEGMWSADKWTYGPCQIGWPPGWGGEVTDSFTQQKVAYSTGQSAVAKAYRQSIALIDDMHWAKPSAVEDAVHYIIAGDCGSAFNIWNANILAYPDRCQVLYCFCDPDPACAGADWDECSWTQQCGLTPEAWYQFFTDPSYRSKETRHMGGSNVGFLDGHARHYLSELIISQQANGDEPEHNLCACWGTPPPQ
ncbi:MAG: prepilin-type N-terminal cleavage/methylation domain-containing protein [Armatimonadota bacterium]